MQKSKHASSRCTQGREEAALGAKKTLILYKALYNMVALLKVS